MYRLIVESLLGLKLDVDKLRIEPCIPADWKSYQMHYRYRETFYHIMVTRTETVPGVTVDGLVQSDGMVHLIDDQKEHLVQVTMR